jgi:hypothetical protein
VLNWPEVEGSSMTFVDQGRAVPTGRQLGLDLGNGGRLHIRVAATPAGDEQAYVLAAVHRDDVKDCGHVGRATDEMRDYVAYAFAQAGYTVRRVALGNITPGDHCDGSRPVSDGYAAVIEMR